ncbi:MAG: class I SAM-dependent methyltransferase [Myxococcota bacterium]
MQASLPVTLGPVQETLLIPLLGRARETEKKRGILGDPKALEIVDSLAFDFSKWEGTRSLVGTCVRTCMFDTYVRDFLKRYPDGTVVELGCGLNTRFERLDNGLARWIEVDLPDVIELRRLFFEEGPRRTLIAASALDTSWMDVAEETRAPVMVVAEAILIYLDAPQARQALEAIAARFPGSWIAFDTTSSRRVDAQARHDAKRHLPSETWFRWRFGDPSEIEAWGVGLRLAESRTFLDAEPSLVAAFPWAFRLLVRCAPWWLRRRIGDYRLNLVIADAFDSAKPEGKP